MMPKETFLETKPNSCGSHQTMQEKRKCKFCLKTKARIKKRYTIRKDNGVRAWLYYDENNEMWNGYRCADCRVARQRKKYGHGSIDECKYPSIVKGRNSERTAKDHFARLGFVVKQARCHGPDLKITKNGITKTCEVKSVIFHKHTRGWYVGPVRSTRKNDDLVSLVFPNNFVHVDTMCDHLSKCNKGGDRFVGKLWKIYKNNTNQLK